MSELESGIFVGHTACSCGSSDALAIHVVEMEDSQSFNGWCYSCTSYFSQAKLNAEGLAQEFIDSAEPLDMPKLRAQSKREPITKEEWQELTSKTTYNAEYRGIHPETMAFFGHRMEIVNNQIKVIYYPETNVNVTQIAGLAGYKSRILPKSFGWCNMGLTGRVNKLSGQHKFEGKGGKYILLAGGENDKAAAYQMLRGAQKDKEYDSIPVVSPTTGEGSAAKQVADNYDFLDSYDWIIVGLDNDEAGRKAAEAVCAVLPADKVKVATWSLKDPHKMLEEGKAKQFVRDFYGAKELMQGGVKDSMDALAEVGEFLTAPKIELPPYMHRIQEAMRGGIKSTGCIGNVIGDTSIGKTYITDNMILQWIFHSIKTPTIVSLERTAGELAVDLLSLHLKKNLSWFKDGMDAIDYLDREDVQEAKLDLFVDDSGKKRFYLIDERTGDITTLMRQVERMGKKYDSKLIIFDPLSDLLRSLGTEAQEEFMQWEKFMKKEGYIFINVLHTRKPPSDKEGKMRKVTEYDAIGSSSFIQSADWNMVLNRDKMAEDPIERNTTAVDLPKCRGGTTGHVADLLYDSDSRQQYDKQDWISNSSGEDTGSEEDNDGKPF